MLIEENLARNQSEKAISRSLECGCNHHLAHIVIYTEIFEISLRDAKDLTKIGFEISETPLALKRTVCIKFDTFDKFDIELLCMLSQVQNDLFSLKFSLKALKENETSLCVSFECLQDQQVEPYLIECLKKIIMSRFRLFEKSLTRHFRHERSMFKFSRSSFVFAILKLLIILLSIVAIFNYSKNCVEDYKAQVDCLKFVLRDLRAVKQAIEKQKDTTI